MATFNDFISNPISEKVVLLWLEPKERVLVTWNSEPGDIYWTETNYFVVGVRVNGTSLTEGSSPSISPDEFYYDPSVGRVYIRIASDPKDVFTSLDYRLFYSSGGYNLPFDLDSGVDVEFEPRVTSVSDFSSQLDTDDLTGISLSGSGTVTLNNNDGGFEPLYDKLFWEGGECRIYLWNPEINITEAQIIYRGKIESKSYSPEQVTFKVKDFVNELRNEIPLDVFSDSDGRIPESIKNKPKRRVYGQVDGLKCVSLDQELEGFPITGTFSRDPAILDRINYSNSGLNAVLYQDDEFIYYDENGDEVKITVKEVQSNRFFATQDVDSFTDVDGFYRPNVPSRTRNREWFICSHTMRAPATTVTFVFDLNRIKVADVTDLDAGDVVFVGAEKKVIRRISSDLIVLDTNLQSTPSIGTAVTKSPVQSVYHENQLMVLDRDYSITNTATKSSIVFEADAEVNVAPEIRVNGSYTFTLGGSTVGVSGVDATTHFQPRDWIRANQTTAFYEVVRVIDENTIDLGGAYGEASATTTAVRKRPKYISDESNITVTCLGKTEDNTSGGTWIRTGSQVVKDLIEEQNIPNSIDSASFDQAKLDAPYLMSLVLPTNPFGAKPRVRDSINLVNQSIFGSLHNDKDFNIVYNVLTPKKPPLEVRVKDDDIVGYSIQSSGKNVTRAVTGDYNFMDYDFTLQDKSNKTLTVVNQYVDYISDITREETREIYLYKQSDALIITQRYSLLREFANLILNIKTKVNLMDKNIGDVIYFELDRIFQRYGTEDDRNRIGAISGMKKGIDSATITVTDLSSMYNKVCTIAEASANIYVNSTKEERAVNGFYTDSFGLVNDDQHTNRMNLVG